MTCSWVRQTLPMFRIRRENCVRLSLVTPERGCGTPWQYSCWCRKCSARVQSWHLCAPCVIGMKKVSISFLRSKNTGGIPPSPIHNCRDSFALSPVPGGRGFLWISDSDSMFTQATQRPWQRQTLSWRRTHLREDFSLSTNGCVMNNSKLGGGDVFSN